MRRTTWRGFAATFAVLPAAALATLVTPMTAAAAPDCNSFTSYSVGNGFMRVPTIGRELGAYNCELGRGNISDAVRVLQASLNRCYFQGLSVDGDFGPRTQAAVRFAQQQYNNWYDPDISVDGRYGPQTRRASFQFALFTTYGGWNVIPTGYCYYRTEP